MDVLSWIVSLISGIIGGNVAGAPLKEKSLGPIGNSLVGLVGGGLGGYILQALELFSKQGGVSALGSEQGLDITAFLANVGSSGVGGAVLVLIAAWIKNAMEKKS